MDRNFLPPRFKRRLLERGSRLWSLNIRVSSAREKDGNSTFLLDLTRFVSITSQTERLLAVFLGWFSLPPHTAARGLAKQQTKQSRLHFSCKGGRNIRWQIIGKPQVWKFPLVKWLCRDKGIFYCSACLEGTATFSPFIGALSAQLARLCFKRSTENTSQWKQ